MICFMPFYVISVSEQVEQFEWFQKWILLKSGEIDTIKLILLRSGFCLLVILSTLISDNIIGI